MSLVFDKEKPAKSFLVDIDEFEKSRVWTDIQTLIEVRLQSNFMTFMEIDHTFDELKALQGSTAELYGFLTLPQQLRNAVESTLEEVRRQNERREQAGT